VVRKRRTLWLVALLFVVMISAWCFMPRSRITRQNFDLITNEMTAEEVREILGQSKLPTANPLAAAERRAGAPSRSAAFVRRYAMLRLLRAAKPSAPRIKMPAGYFAENL
jgi:hypothetical protein